MTDGLGDFFGGGGGGPAAISWDSVPVGTTWTGTILPADPNTPTVGYKTTHASNIDGEPLYWRPKNMPGDRAQITEAEFNGVKNRPVLQAEILVILHDAKPGDFMSDNAKARMTENEETDDGLRRTFVKGKSYTEGFNDALKALGAKTPPVGAEISQTLTQRKPIPGSKYKENIFTVTIAKPSKEGMARVAAYLELQAKPDETDSPFESELPF